MADLLKRGRLKIEEIAKMADVGVASVYRIKRDLSQSAEVP
ncbi:MAG: hypothetical protein LBJ37_14525 [Paucimonas sp.]|nr:hypothetical protein [Paucimonas sp.]